MSSTEERLSHVESTLAEQGASLRALSTQVGSIGNKLDQLIDKKTEKPWGLVLAASAVILTLVSLGGFPIWRDIDRVALKQESLDEHMRTHEMAGGHQAMMARVTALEKSVITLDETLQREMRLLDAENRASTKALDEMLQREMDLKDAAIFTDLNVIRTELLRLRAWQEERQAKSVQSNTEQGERIKALEREIFNDKMD